MLTPEQIAGHRTAAIAHNTEVKAELLVMIDELAVKLDAAVAKANTLVIFAQDEIPRIQDNLATSVATLKLNLEQIVRPNIQPPPQA